MWSVSREILIQVAIILHSSDLNMIFMDESKFSLFMNHSPIIQENPVKWISQLLFMRKYPAVPSVDIHICLKQLG